MDERRFDALARTMSAVASRRGALAALLAAIGAPWVLGPDTAARRRNAKGKNRKRDHDDRRDQRKPTRKRKRKNRGGAAPPGQCCGGGDCAPGQGKNLGHCCFQDRDFTAANFQGANLGEASFARANLTAADFTAANLDQTCFVDANTTGARFGAANRGAAIFCRTETSSGLDDSGCDRGSPCCPTCDDNHPCAPSQRCCDGRCVTGECCAASDCPNEVCQRRACDDHQCIYTPVSGEPGPGCQSVCCEDAQGQPICCPPGVTTCDARGVCCSAESRDQTCGVGTPSPKCGSVANNCGQRVDCGPCPVRTCRFGRCEGQGNTCAYTPVFGRRGPECQTVCCADAQGEPVCCAEGTTHCQRNGACVCGTNADCGPGKVCCTGACEDGVWVNQTTFGSDGSGPSQFNSPNGVAVSTDALTAWVADLANNRISVWTRPEAGSNAWTNQATFGGGPGNGPDQLQGPHSVAVSEDGLTAWVADTLNHRVSVWTRPDPSSAAWTNQTTFGSGPGNGPTNFNLPWGVAVSKDARTVWIADQLNHRVSVWRRPDPASAAWANQTTFGSGPGNGPDQFRFPTGVTVAEDDLTAWVADLNNRISVWTRPDAGSTAWANQTTFGSGPGNGPDQFRGPADVAVSADERIAWVADTLNHRVSVWTRPDAGSTAWANQTTFGSGPGNGPSQFNRPFGLAVLTDEPTVWVADTNNRRVSVWGLGCLFPEARRADRKRSTKRAAG